MIVMGNSTFATAMKFCGIKNSHFIRKREDAIRLMQEMDSEEIILTNTSVIEMVPELKEFRNVVSLPDDAAKLGNIDDLKHIIKSAVGIELEVV